MEVQINFDFQSGWVVLMNGGQKRLRERRGWMSYCAVRGSLIDSPKDRHLIETYLTALERASFNISIRGTR